MPGWLLWDSVLMVRMVRGRPSSVLTGTEEVFPDRRTLEEDLALLCK